MLLQLQGKRAENGYKRKKLKLSMPVANTSGPCSDMEIEDAEGIEIIINLTISYCEDCRSKSRLNINMLIIMCFMLYYYIDMSISTVSFDYRR